MWDEAWVDEARQAKDLNVDDLIDVLSPELTSVIQAPIERVWAFLTDPEKVSTCAPGLESVEILVPGQRFRAVAKQGTMLRQEGAEGGRHVADRRRSACGRGKSQDAPWIPLFNGKDLSGWVPKIKGYAAGENFGNTFRVEDGILKVSYDQYQKFDDQFRHLFYKELFSHYRLRVERGSPPATTPSCEWPTRS